MIYFWRFLSIFGLLNLINILVFGGAVGMEFVWFTITTVSFILSFRKPYVFFFSKKIIKVLFTMYITIFLFVEGCIFYHGSQLISSNEYDYLIVLGAGLRGETLSYDLKYRLDTAYEYLTVYPNTKAILTGGQGPGETITEAEAMHRYLVKKGIEPERLILEEQATDTVENLTYSFELIDTLVKEPEIMVVTSKFHILRSKMIADELGYKVDGLGSKNSLFLTPNYYLREFFAVIAEFIF